MNVLFYAMEVPNGFLQEATRNATASDDAELTKPLFISFNGTQHSQAVCTNNLLALSSIRSTSLFHAVRQIDHSSEPYKTSAHISIILVLFLLDRRIIIIIIDYNDLSIDMWAPQIGENWHGAWPRSLLRSSGDLSIVSSMSKRRWRQRVHLPSNMWQRTMRPTVRLRVVTGTRKRRWSHCGRGMQRRAECPNLWVKWCETMFRYR